MTRRLLSALVTGSALALLAACGAAGTAGEATVLPAGPLAQTVVPVVPSIDKPTGRPAPSVAVVPPTATDAPPGYTELPADRLDTRALPAEYRQRRAWVAEDGLGLRVVGVARDGCAGVDGTALESADEVRVLLAPRTAPQGGPVDGPICTQVLTEEVVTVALSAPLGARTVVVEATG
ncbi:hypothetical protein [Actinokineospora spheciospongiae]|uniref:hypothetical protein n=1 Tax=Actinokineospora spheciospongiae TaxID=909613 RepID=UPI000D710186|nr:hypothetical protein [Actinokineospora spheciospongiae]PWW58487.1 hypothetical protein DFQ13_109280 [Actinokineospora spheciospongiae]